MAAGSIVIDLLLKTGSFETSSDRAAKASKKLSADIDKQFKAIGAVIGGAAVAGFGALTLAIKGTVQQADELRKLSSIAGATSEEFQRFAVASETVGLSQEKLGDIFKDFREKVGEFVQTGGGGMKDFFEQIAPKVGITAEAFRNLSGPQALQLYLDTLQKAGLSQEQMSFYLESMASDTTALIPLLRDGGKELQRLGDQAERSGRIMSDETQAGALELKNQMIELDGVMQGVRNTIASAVIPTLVDYGKQLLDARDSGLSLMEAIVGLGLSDPTKEPREHVERLKKDIEDLRKDMAKPLLLQSIPTALAGEGRMKQLEKELAYWQKQAGRAGVAIGPPAPETPAVTGTGGGTAWKPPPKTGSTGAPKVSDLDRMSKAFADQAATVGKTSEEIELYRYKLAGASPAQLAFAASVQDSIKSFEAQAKAMSEGQRITESMRTPAETLSASVVSLNDYLQSGAIDWETYSRAVFAAQDAFDGTEKAAKDAMEQQAQALQAARDSLYSGLLSEEEEIARSYERRKEAILDATEITETERQDLLARLDEKATADRVAREQTANAAIYGAYSALFDGIAGITKSAAGEQSTAYRAMFAVSKAFALAEAALQVQLAISKAGGAKSFPWNLADMAAVAAAMGGVVSTISGVSFGGARADGGSVSSDRRYLVGERGPEMFVPNTAGTIVPNDVMAGKNEKSAAPNIRIVNAFDTSMLGDYIGSDAGEQAVMNVVQRNASTVRQMAGGV